MQLSGPEIKKYMQMPPLKRLLNRFGANYTPQIVITPFDENCLGSNSYDLHLDKILKVYKQTIPWGMLPAIEFDKQKYEAGKYSMQDWFDPKTSGYSDYINGHERYDVRNPNNLIDPTETDKKTLEIEIPETGLILNPEVGYLGCTTEWTETYKLFPYIDGRSTIGRNFIITHHTAGRGDDGFCGQWTLEIKVLHPAVVYPNMRIGQIYYEKFCGKRNPYNENPNSHYNNQRGATGAAMLSIDNKLSHVK